MSNKPESLVFAGDRPSSLDDTLYQWAVDAEDMIREMQKHIDDLNKENSMQDKRNIENIVQEIMTLIDGYAASASTNLHMLIESKLRELVENKFSVREPLSDKVIKMIDDSTHFHESTDWSIRFARAIERAHNITKDS